MLLAPLTFQFCVCKLLNCTRCQLVNDVFPNMHSVCLVSFAFAGNFTAESEEAALLPSSVIVRSIGTQGPGTARGMQFVTSQMVQRYAIVGFSVPRSNRWRSPTSLLCRGL